MDIVNVTCYGKTERMERQKAINKFAEAIAWSDGSEKERYANILVGLLSGSTDVSDEY